MSKVTEALMKIGAKPATHLPEYAHGRWKRQELKKLLTNKAVRNPLLSSARSMLPSGLMHELKGNMIGGASGSALATAVDVLITDKLTGPWHTVGHAASAALAAVAPASRFTAGYGGAAFYPLISMGYKKMLSLLPKT